MRHRGKPITLVLCACLALLAGCSQVGLVYNRLDTIVRYEVGRYVDLDKPQRAALDSRLQAMWQWHRTTQLPLYAAGLREVAGMSADAVSVEQIRGLGEQIRIWMLDATAESLKLAAPTLADLSDTQVQELLANIDREAAKALKRNRKLSDAKWREKRGDDAIDRLEDWAGSSTAVQRERIREWAAGLQRPVDDSEAQQAGFEELLKSRRDPDFRQRLQDQVSIGGGDDDGRIQASRQLLADLSASLSPEQREYLRKRLLNLARQLDELVTQ
jgi:hypothetical protein